MALKGKKPKEALVPNQCRTVSKNLGVGRSLKENSKLKRKLRFGCCVEGLKNSRLGVTHVRHSATTLKL